MAASELLGASGLRLAADTWGDPGSPPLLLLHGGGQTRGAWSGSGSRLAALGFRVIALDLRGHGESEWAPAYAIDNFADDVRAVCASLGRPVVLVGASLGGISSLLAAGEAPRVEARAVVLVDIAHRPEKIGVSRILSFMKARPDGFASIEEAAEAVGAYLKHRPAPESIEGLKRNLRPKNGRWVWHWDPRLVEDFSNLDGIPRAAERFLTAARSVRAPILVVRGRISDVLTDEIAREFLEQVPGAQYVDVADAGHMVAGDRNDRFLEAIAPFVSGAAPGARSD